MQIKLMWKENDHLSCEMYPNEERAQERQKTLNELGFVSFIEKQEIRINEK